MFSEWPVANSWYHQEWGYAANVLTAGGKMVQPACLIVNGRDLVMSRWLLELCLISRLLLKTQLSCLLVAQNQAFLLWNYVVSPCWSQLRVVTSSELWNSCHGELSFVRVGVVIMICLENSCFLERTLWAVWKSLGRAHRFDLWAPSSAWE